MQIKRKGNYEEREISRAREEHLGLSLWRTQSSLSLIIKSYTSRWWLRVPLPRYAADFTNLPQNSTPARLAFSFFSSESLACGGASAERQKIRYPTKHKNPFGARHVFLVTLHSRLLLAAMAAQFYFVACLNEFCLSRRIFFYKSLGFFFSPSQRRIIYFSSHSDDKTRNSWIARQFSAHKL